MGAQPRGTNLVTCPQLARIVGVGETAIRRYIRNGWFTPAGYAGRTKSIELYAIPTPERIAELPALIEERRKQGCYKGGRRAAETGHAQAVAAKGRATRVAKAQSLRAEGLMNRRQLARYLRVHACEVNRWVEAGLLSPALVSESGKQKWFARPSAETIESLKATCQRRRPGLESLLSTPKAVKEPKVKTIKISPVARAPKPGSEARRSKPVPAPEPWPSVDGVPLVRGEELRKALGVSDNAFRNYIDLGWITVQGRLKATGRALLFLPLSEERVAEIKRLAREREAEGAKRGREASVRSKGYLIGAEKARIAHQGFAAARKAEGLLTKKELADFLKVHSMVVNRWLQDGHIVPSRISPNGKQMWFQTPEGPYLARLEELPRYGKERRDAEKATKVAKPQPKAAPKAAYDAPRSMSQPKAKAAKPAYEAPRSKSAPVEVKAPRVPVALTPGIDTYALAASEGKRRWAGEWGKSVFGFVLAVHTETGVWEALPPGTKGGPELMARHLRIRERYAPQRSFGETTWRIDVIDHR